MDVVLCGFFPSPPTDLAREVAVRPRPAPLNYFDPQASLGISEYTGWVGLVHIASLGARDNTELSQEHQHRHLGFQEGKSHPEAGAGALAKTQEGVAENIKSRYYILNCST